jgi:hypothetical protein
MGTGRVEDIQTGKTTKNGEVLGNLYNEKGEIKAASFREMVSGMLHDMDRGDKLMGIIPIGGAHDGQLSKQEVMHGISALEKEIGMKMPDELKAELATVFKDTKKLSVADTLEGLDAYIKAVDKNKDGILSDKEITGAKSPTQIATEHLAESMKR